MENCKKAKHVSRCLQLAIVLEVSADKPGNVNLTVGFEGTRVEHFLASAIAPGTSFQEAAYRGIEIAENKREMKNAGLGELIKMGIADINSWQRGGNTLLGTILLFAPLAVAAGVTPTKKNYVYDLKQLQENLGWVINSTTPKDAVNVYEAIEIAKPNGLNNELELSVNDPDSKARLIKENVNLLDTFRIAKDIDDICSEYVNIYPITFNFAYPYLIKQLKGNDLNTSIVNTFLKILSKHPDTFISRKVGVEKATQVSVEAKKIIDSGGAGTVEGKNLLVAFDQMLREKGNDYNPGTTADITAAALALCTLNGYRP